MYGFEVFVPFDPLYESVTVKDKEYVPAVVGVPVISPDEADKAKPGT